MNLAFYLRQMRREGRGSVGRLAFFVACLAVGVAAVVAVAGLSASLDEGIRTEARQLLAADLAVTSRRPPAAGVPTLFDELALEHGLRRVDLKEMATVVLAPAPDGGLGRSQLVELKVVSGDYPFYGRLRLAPGRPLAELLEPETAVVAPDLLARLRLSVGDEIRLGGESFEIAGTVLSEPDRINFGLTLGPRVFLSAEGLERTTLLQKGSRIDHRFLFAVPPEAEPETVDLLAELLRDELPPYYRVETFRDAQPALRSGLQRVDRFLGLVALLSLLIGGIGVAQTVRAWVAGRLDGIAVLKCLGLRPREIAALYLGQAILLGLAGSAAGVAVGAGLQALAPLAFPDLIPRDLIQPFQPLALLRGLGLGIGVAVLFSAPSLVSVWSIPPARVLRRDADPLPGNRPIWALSLLTLTAGLFAMAWLQSRSLLLGLQFLGGLAGVAVVLAAAAWVLTRATARLPRDLPVTVRYGLAALSRPGATTLGAVVALGLGILVVLGMYLIERQLARELTAQLPKQAPSAFMVDIQPDQWPEIEEILRASGSRDLESVPVVTARLSSVEGVAVDALIEATRGSGEGARARRWALTREQRLTYMEELPADNQIVAGALWSRPELPEVSVEEEFAADLGIGVGSTLTFNVQGTEIGLLVTSVRQVDWSTFGINFFLVVEPGVLEDAPQQRVATVILPPEAEQPLQDRLAESFPNVTFLKVREILERIVAVLDRVGLGVRFLGLFTVVAGLAILAGAVSASAVRRNREVALLKTLGMTRKGVAAVFSIEYALLGLVAGLIGALGATAMAWAVLTRGMEAAFELDPVPVAVAVVASVVLTAGAGLATSARALSRSPIEVLRGE